MGSVDVVGRAVNRAGVARNIPSRRCGNAEFYLSRLQYMSEKGLLEGEIPLDIKIYDSSLSRGLVKALKDQESLEVSPTTVHQSISAMYDIISRMSNELDSVPEDSELKAVLYEGLQELHTSIGDTLEPFQSVLPLSIGNAMEGFLKYSPQWMKQPHEQLDAKHFFSVIGKLIDQIVDCLKYAKSFVKQQQEQEQ